MTRASRPTATTTTVEPQPVAVTSNAPRVATLAELVASADVVAARRGDGHRARPAVRRAGRRRGGVAPRDAARRRGAGRRGATRGAAGGRGGGLARGRHADRRGRRARRRQVGDDAIWFLDAVGTDELPVYVAVSAQGRYLVVDGDLVGAAGDDPLDRRAGRRSRPTSSSRRHRRAAEPRSAQRPSFPGVDPTGAPEARRPRASASGVLLCLSLPPFGFWPLAAVGPRRPRPADRRPARQGALPPRLAGGDGLLRAVARLDDRAHRAGLRDRLRGVLGMLGAGIAAAPPGRGRWLALAGTWTLAELLRWTWPFGGVPLANLAIGQVSGPLAPVLRVGRQPAARARGGAGRPGRRRGDRGGRGAGPAASRSASSCSSRLSVAAPSGHAVGTRRGRARAGRRRAGHPQDRRRA